MGYNNPSTLGAEFESVIGQRELVSLKLAALNSRKNYFKSVTNDASVQSQMTGVGSSSSLFLGNMLVRNYLRRRTEMVAGYEIVTNPLELSEMRLAINQVINMQRCMGEIWSERSSIHIHAGFPPGLIFSKLAVALGLKVEPLFYKIAGMGTNYRGMANNSTYCRPLALPPAVRLSDRKGEFAVLDPKGSLEAENTEEFWGRFGGIIYGDTERYNPLRYFAINIFSTTLRGTMEFRFFNFCSVSRYVQAIAGLSQFVADLMLRASFKSIDQLDNISIFKENNNNDYHNLLNQLLSMGSYYDSEIKMAERDVANIHELIEVTPQPIFKDKVVLSHIKTARISSGQAKSFKLRLVEDVESCGNVDIHNFGDENRTLLGGC